MKIKSGIIKTIMYIAAVMTLSVLLFLILYILVKGIPNLSLDLFAPKYTSENLSVVPAIVNTLTITIIALAIAVPIGIFSAIYLTEYTSKSNAFVKVVRITAETLSGIPSIVYGLFGFLMFTVGLGWSYTLFGGSLTLAIMVLPVIMRTTEEALISVPDTYREGSYGLGAGKLRTIFKIVLPSAVPGIMSGIILSIGRIVGETAALIFTAGTVANIPESVMKSGRTLAVHMYVLSNEGLHIEKTYATAVVLLIVVIIINIVSSKISKRITGDKNDKN